MRTVSGVTRAEAAGASRKRASVGKVIVASTCAVMGFLLGAAAFFALRSEPPADPLGVGEVVALAAGVAADDFGDEAVALAAGLAAAAFGGAVGWLAWGGRERRTQAGFTKAGA